MGLNEKTPPAIADGVYGRRAGGERAAKTNPRSDREFERPRHLLLDRLDGVRHRLLSERAEVLALAGYRFDLLASEFGLQRYEIGQRLHGEDSLQEIEVGVRIDAQHFESLGVDGERAVLSSREAHLEGAGGFIRRGLGFGECRARLDHTLFQRAAEALLDLRGRRSGEFGFARQNRVERLNDSIDGSRGGNLQGDSAFLGCVGHGTNLDVGVDVCALMMKRAEAASMLSLNLASGSFAGWSRTPWPAPATQRAGF